MKFEDNVHEGDQVVVSSLFHLTVNVWRTVTHGSAEFGGSTSTTRNPLLVITLEGETSEKVILKKQH